MGACGEAAAVAVLAAVAAVVSEVVVDAVISAVGAILEAVVTAIFAIIITIDLISDLALVDSTAQAITAQAFTVILMGIDTDMDTAALTTTLARMPIRQLRPRHDQSISKEKFIRPIRNNHVQITGIIAAIRKAITPM